MTRSAEVTVVTVMYEPSVPRIEDVTRQALEAFSANKLAGEVLLIDNSPDKTDEADNIARDHVEVRLIWNRGYNLYLAGALNRAIREAAGEYVVYLCASHGRAIDATWMRDLIDALSANRRAAMAGHVQPCQFDRVAATEHDFYRTELDGRQTILPQIHVQGGVWAARTQLLRDLTFGHRFPFEFCDVDFSRRCLALGYDLVDVETVRSLATGTIKLDEMQHVKFVHDYR